MGFNTLLPFYPPCLYEARQSNTPMISIHGEVLPFPPFFLFQRFSPSVIMLVFNKIKITAWHVYILTFWLICILLYQLRSTFDLSFSTPPTHDSLEPARQISATELLSRPLTKDLTSIPRILHQCYFHPSDKPDTLPPDMEKWSAGCRKQHSDWEWVLWSDADNLKLVQKYYPWLEESYRALPKEIFRADMARTLYMYTFGG